jgi:hypothetical protein
MQLLQAVTHSGLHEVVIDQPFGQQLESQGELLAPGSMLIQVLIETHTQCLVGLIQYSIALPPVSAPGSRSSVR